jgi:hypothetical protein
MGEFASHARLLQQFAGLAMSLSWRRHAHRYADHAVCCAMGRCADIDTGEVFWDAHGWRINHCLQLAEMADARAGLGTVWNDRVFPP